MPDRMTGAAPRVGVDARPVFHVVGWVVAVLGALMLIPAAVDVWDGVPGGGVFLECAAITGFVGGALILTTSNSLGPRLDARQAYLLTFLIWTFVPLFSALPFMLGPPGLSFTQAYFESVSGVTTTGSTVIVGLDSLPAGVNLWRGLLNWIGGLGIAFVAMIFLPLMRVGGMQFFRTEGFDTMGKALPRAVDIAWSLVLVYAGLSVACILAYRLVGMTGLDASVHGMATIATGGFSPSDLSFGKYPGTAEYVGAVFMILGALPYIRYVQMTAGAPGAVLRDLQVRKFLLWLSVAVALVFLWRVTTSDMATEPAFRETLFNLTSIMTGTGFFSGSFAGWEGFAMTVAFVVGLIGGCSGSSTGALSVFRVHLAFRALAVRLRIVFSPSRVLPLTYDGRRVEPDVVDALMLYVTGYILAIGTLSVGLTLAGVDAVSAVFAVWTSIGNIGYSFGPLTQPTGTFGAFPEAALWIMTLAMILGRLGMLTLFVLILPRFWIR